MKISLPSKKTLLNFAVPIICGLVIVAPAVGLNSADRNNALTWIGIISSGIFLGVILILALIAALVLMVAKETPAQPREEKDDLVEGEDLGGGINPLVFGDDLLVDPDDIVFVAIVDAPEGGACDELRSQQVGAITLVDGMRQQCSKKAAQQVIAYFKGLGNVAANAGTEGK